MVTAIDKKADNNMIEQMFEAGAHFGYSKAKRHPSVKPFIFGTKNRVEIFDLEKTSESLDKAKEFAKNLATERKQILFVSSKSEARDAVETGASSINMPFVTGRWIGGTLTNYKEIRGRVEKFQKMESEKEKGLLSKYTKKERLMIDKNIEKLSKKFSGLVSAEGMPAALFVIDPKKEEIAVLEALDRRIPVIALANSDCNIKSIKYPIVANDSAKSSIQFFVKEIVEAYSEGKKLAPKATAKPVKPFVKAMAPRTAFRPAKRKEDK